MKLKLKICLLAMLNFMKEGGGNDKIKMFVLHECKVLDKKGWLLFKRNGVKWLEIKFGRGLNTNYMIITTFPFSFHSKKLSQFCCMMKMFWYNSIISHSFQTANCIWDGTRENVYETMCALFSCVNGTPWIIRKRRGEKKTI